MVVMEGHVSDAMAAAAITDDDGSMQNCPDHPFKNSSPGGICAFCLQEKLGKLVSSSSSFPIAVFPASSSSSSSSPSPSSSSFRSHPIPSTTTTTTINNNNNNNSSSSAITVRPISVSSSSSLTSMSLSMATITNNNNNSSDSCHSRKAILPFLIAHKKKKKKEATMAAALKRSKSTTAPRRGGGGAHFLDSDDGDVFSPRRRGFWSFLHPSSKHSSGRKIDKSSRDLSYGSSNLSSSASTLAPASSGNGSFSQRSRERKEKEKEKEEFGESPTKASLERKVARSRSVGCGSRSFSGDFFERISTGFGDCTLRRVESQREGKPKVSSAAAGDGNGNGLDCIKERVKCGGIFSGFMMNSSSSSSSSSSYWISSSTEETNNNNNMNGNGNGNGNGGVIRANGVMGHHGRSRSWGWAFASPIRAFGKRGEASNKAARTTPNLAAIPSLLAVRT